MKHILLIFVFAFFLLNLSSNAYAQLIDERAVILHTQSGEIVIELFYDDAPKTVENFLKLVDDGFYDDIIFHRIIKDFMIQGGDPLSKQIENENQWGTGNAGYTIQAEFNTIKHDRGIVSMARSADPNSASSQFFIVHKDSNFLDEQYTVFGRIATQESYDTLDVIASLETGARDIPVDIEQAKILQAEVVQRSEISNLLELGEPERVLSSTTESILEPYTNEELGISFIAPQGWLIQEPEKTNPGIPDVVVIGPASGTTNPIISISIDDVNNRSVEDYLFTKKTALQQSIETEQLTIISEKVTTVNGKEAYVLEVLTKFPTESGTINVKFLEILIPTSEKFYTLTYANDENNYENELENFNTALNSFVILSEANEIPTEETITDQVSDEETDIEEGGGCLIATATFGSELAPQVQQLRELRDNTLLQTELGSTFMSGFNQLYYSFSPTIADWERENPAFKETVKLAITPLLTSLSLLNHVNMDSEAEVLGYGIGIILMNIGMYFVIPAMIVYRLRK